MEPGEYDNIPMSFDKQGEYPADVPESSTNSAEFSNVNRYAFVVHPLDIHYIHRHPLFGWSRFLPDGFVEWIGAWFPPIFLSRIRGGHSAATGQKVEGFLYSLGTTPRQMLTRSERFTYKRLIHAARIAERQGARIMGLGAFTSVVGDAGVTIAKESDIAITSGNSLSVAVTIETAKKAIACMGRTDISQCKAMVIGATGSIGSACARLLAEMALEIVLVSVDLERLSKLRSSIWQANPSVRIEITTKPDDFISDCDLIITATSAIESPILDIKLSKPGAVICDVARPANVSRDEAALRPDVLVVESGEVIFPGEVDFGYDIGLPAKSAYACLAETALLAMEGRFEDYSIGRDISTQQVKEIYQLFIKHGFKISGLRSFGETVTDEIMAEKHLSAEKM